MLDGKERELVEEALVELRKMGGRRHVAVSCLTLALDPTTPTWPSGQEHTQAKIRKEREDAHA